MNTASPTPRRRRWLQISLRAWLALLLALSVVVGFWLQSAIKQHEAVATLEAAGFRVGYDYQESWLRRFPAAVRLLEQLAPNMHEHLRCNVSMVFPSETHAPGLSSQQIALLGTFSHLDALSLEEIEIKNDDLKVIGGLTTLDVLAVHGPTLNDAGMVHLCNLKKLRYLFVGRARLSQTGLSNICALPSLKGLFLTTADLSNDDLRIIGRMRNLTALSLADSVRITDEGLAHLSSLINLKVIHLNGLRISDAGLAHLAGCSQLELINVGNDYHPNAEGPPLDLPKGCRIRWPNAIDVPRQASVPRQ